MPSFDDYCLFITLSFIAAALHYALRHYASHMLMIITPAAIDCRAAYFLIRLHLRCHFLYALRCRRHFADFQLMIAADYDVADDAAVFFFYVAFTRCCRHVDAMPERASVVTT